MMRAARDSEAAPAVAALVMAIGLVRSGTSRKAIRVRCEPGPARRPYASFNNQNPYELFRTVSIVRVCYMSDVVQ